MTKVLHARTDDELRRTGHDDLIASDRYVTEALTIPDNKL